MFAQREKQLQQQIFSFLGRWKAQVEDCLGETASLSQHRYTLQMGKLKSTFKNYIYYMHILGVGEK